ncbi:MAG: hypothetical protein D6794_08655 [Deltaproteobacteria bacterium]|nr:MAG: hypothetical protein D6794_08655 [Deltaproteobacteria bacterium]
MPYDPKKHHRRSIRLKGYDYAQPGAYFLTICTQNRACLFGEVVDGKMVLNEAGRMVHRWWNELNNKFPHVRTDAFVVMPNHIHGIIIIPPTVGADLRVRPDENAQHVRPDENAQRVRPDENAQRVRPDENAQHVRPDENAPHVRPDGQQHARETERRTRPGAPLPQIVQWFKTMSTNEYIRQVKNAGWAPFHKRLWQRNYYEHIIRDERSLKRIRQYIADNPLRWHLDRQKPGRK